MVVEIYLKMKKLLLFLILFNTSLIYPQDIYSDLNYKKKQWVDSIYNAMTPKERVGQLFMIQAFSNKGLNKYGFFYGGEHLI